MLKIEIESKHNELLSVEIINGQYFVKRADVVSNALAKIKIRINVYLDNSLISLEPMTRIELVTY